MDVLMWVQLIRILTSIFTWTLVASVLVSFFLPPFHPVREALDRLVDPFLSPIRRVMPPAGMFDFSPLILLFAIELVSRVLIAILLSLS